jgi:hypothetical protein
VQPRNCSQKKRDFKSSENKQPNDSAIGPKDDCQKQTDQIGENQQRQQAKTKTGPTRFQTPFHFHGAFGSAQRSNINRPGTPLTKARYQRPTVIISGKAFSG